MNKPYTDREKLTASERARNRQAETIRALNIRALRHEREARAANNALSDAVAEIEALRELLQFNGGK